MSDYAESFCARCEGDVQRLTGEQLTFMNSHSMQDWPVGVCAECGHEGIRNKREYLHR